MSPIMRFLNKDTRIVFTWSEPQLLIKCYYDNSAAPIGLVSEKWPELRSLQRLFLKSTDTQTTVPFSSIDSVRALFEVYQRKYERQSKLSFEIDERVTLLLTRPTPPPDFAVRYVWEEGALHRRLPQNVVEADDGWLLRGREIWNYPELNADALKVLRTPVITQGQLLSFVRDALPRFREAGVNVISDIEYSDNPALTLRIHSVNYDSIHIEPQWTIAPASIDETAQVPGMVLSGSTLRSGINPGELTRVLYTLDGDNALRGTDIGRFLHRYYNDWKPWISGDTEAFEKLHKWILPPYSWILYVKSPLEHGVGKATAYPIACLGDDRLTLAEVRAAQQSDYVHLSTGWLRSELLTSLESLNSDAFDSVNSYSFTLDVQQLLHHGDKRLDSRWRGMIVEGAEWLESGNKHIVADNHLRFLIHWGINGGLTGGYEAFASYGIPVITELAEAHPECSILIACAQDDVEYLTGSLQPALRLNDVSRIASYESIARDRELNKKQWDLIVMLEPDDGLADDLHNDAIVITSRLNTACVLCFPLRFGGGFDASQSDTRTATLIGYGDSISLGRMLIRDCRREMRLPQRFRFKDQLPDSQLFIGNAGNNGLSTVRASYYDEQDSVSADELELPDEAEFTQANAPENAQAPQFPLPELTEDSAEAASPKVSLEKPAAEGE